jgi:hypothetical protein
MGRKHRQRGVHLQVALWEGGRRWISETAVVFGVVCGILGVSAAGRCAGSGISCHGSVHFSFSLSGGDKGCVCQTAMASLASWHEPRLAPLLQLTALGIGLFWDPADVAGSFAEGARWAWVTNK